MCEMLAKGCLSQKPPWLWRTTWSSSVLLDPLGLVGGVSFVHLSESVVLIDIAAPSSNSSPCLRHGSSSPELGLAKNRGHRSRQVQSCTRVGLLQPGGFPNALHLISRVPQDSNSKALMNSKAGLGSLERKDCLLA